MRLFTNDLMLIPCDGFGPISMTQSPDRIVSLEPGWRAVGVMSQHGSSWVVAQRRRWFWKKDARTRIECRVVVGDK